MPANIGWANTDAKSPLQPFPFDRAPIGDEDVRIDVVNCGVCHSDVHQARDEWQNDALKTNFPCMPGHEIAGTVSEVGAKVTEHAVGDRVGVGCMVYWGSDDQRGVQEENYQVPPAVFTYNAPDPDSGEVTFGGYSDQVLVNQHFVLKLPDALPFEKAAPILCAGVTTWSPLDHWGVGKGHTVAVAGIGGLGHMAIQLAKARGAERVVALTTTPEKVELAKRLGADEAVLMSDEDAVGRLDSTFDFVLTTIPTAFDMNPYLQLIKHDGTLVTVGMLEPIPEGGVDFAVVSQKRISISGSMIGSIAETQAVLDFCAEHDVAPEVHVIPIDRINDAFDEIVANDVHFRYVIDNASLKA